MFRIKIIMSLALMAVLALPGCGDDGSEPSSSPESQPSTAAESDVATEETEEAEEEVSACVGKKKGPVTTVQAGKTGDDLGDPVKFVPDKIELPAGKFVTLKLVYVAGPTHNFTIDEIDCDAGLIAVGDEVFVSFKVPKGTTPFYCAPHEDVGMDGKIVAK